MGFRHNPKRDSARWHAMSQRDPDKVAQETARTVVDLVMQEIESGGNLSMAVSAVKRELRELPEMEAFPFAAQHYDELADWMISVEGRLDKAQRFIRHVNHDFYVFLKTNGMLNGS